MHSQLAVIYRKYEEKNLLEDSDISYEIPMHNPVHLYLNHFQLLLEINQQQKLFH